MINVRAPPEPDFLRYSPRPQVPVRVEREDAAETVVFKSRIIQEYLDDRFPRHPLLPKSPAARALEDICDTYFDAITWGLIEIRFFGRAPGELAAQLAARAAEQLQQLYGFLTRYLGAGDFFHETQFGSAELAVFRFMACAELHGPQPTPGSQLAAWFQRVRARDSDHKTLAAAQAVLG